MSMFILNSCYIRALHAQMVKADNNNQRKATKTKTKTKTTSSAKLKHLALNQH